ncbi:phosphatidylglycerophosphatase and protein-tyrosine phosphatase 1-like [Littorina saxatilis]|uniref:Phosphatidylglycerophosphatase and protein-tyrosine phosphatase 1 n=1 Tax=Littorina saxatilis TaxID=31220 RepID=A0AAN9GDP5_9CAEN
MPSNPAEIFARVAFYPTLFYTYVMSRVTSRQWYSRVDQWVVVGGLPIKSIAQQLVSEENIKGVVSLTQDFETEGITPSEKEWNDMGVEQLMASTVDFTGTPSQENIRRSVDFMMQHRQKNNSVYVHCKAGRTRSVTVVACYLIHVNQMTPEEAVDFVKSKRPHIWLREKQLKSIHAFYNGSTSSVSSSPSTTTVNSSNSSSLPK